MAQATDMPRNETGIDTALGILKQQFGERFQTGDAIREQHGHTTTWIRNQAPDAVVFARSTDDVAAVVKVCAAHKVPVIAFGTGTSLEGHVNAPAGACRSTSRRWTLWSRSTPAIWIAACNPASPARR